MQNLKKTFVASASELQSSDLYMTIKTIMFTVPSANLNGVRCTEAFLDEIVENQSKYVGLPLCADVVNLVKGRYQKLGHCYNPKTGTFSSSMIGSFYEFEKEELKNGEVALVGYARILKRNKHVCKAVCELFAAGALKVSFEIACGSYEELDDETILIDKADENYLEGMCIVSFPACPQAVAQDLVAEINGIGKEAENMTDVIESAEITAEETVEQAAPEAEEMIAEEQTEERAATESEVASEEEQPVIEQAQVFVTQTHIETDIARAFDNETGAEIEIVEERRITEHSVQEEPAQEAPVAAEQTEQAEVAEQTEVAEETVAVEHADAVSVEVVDERDEAVAALQAIVQAMRAELDELIANKAQTQIAEVHSDNEVNPFIAEMSAPKRYSLLDAAEKSTSFSLLEKA